MIHGGYHSSDKIIAKQCPLPTATGYYTMGKQFSETPTLVFAFIILANHVTMGMNPIHYFQPWFLFLKNVVDMI